MCHREQQVGRFWRESRRGRSILVCLRKSKDASVAGAEQAKGRHMGNEMREVSGKNVAWCLMAHYEGFSHWGIAQRSGYITNL